MTLGRPGRLRGPRRNLMKFGHALADSPVERYLSYVSYYRSDELARWSAMISETLAEATIHFATTVSISRASKASTGSISSSISI